MQINLTTFRRGEMTNNKFLISLLLTALADCTIHILLHNVSTARCLGDDTHGIFFLGKTTNRCAFDFSQTASDNTGLSEAGKPTSYTQLSASSPTWTYYHIRKLDPYQIVAWQHNLKSAQYVITFIVV